jgi:hypothetical protein
VRERWRREIARLVPLLESSGWPLHPTAALSALLFFMMASQGYAVAPPGFGPMAKNKRWRCEASRSLRQQASFPVPEHAAVLDMGNGPFWRNPRTWVVDLGSAEVLLYRYPPDHQGGQHELRDHCS